MKFEWFSPTIQHGRPVRRAWVGELPPLQYNPGSVLRWKASGNGPIAEEREAAVEWFRPAGVTHYGLLGGRFKPGRGEHLLVEVAVSFASEVRQWPLGNPPAAPWGSTFVGLPLELAEGVIDGVQQATKLALLGPGTLRFDHAAYNDVISVKIDFRELAQVVVRLLTRASPSSTGGEILLLLRREP